MSEEVELAYDKSHEEQVALSDDGSIESQSKNDEDVRREDSIDGRRGHSKDTEADSVGSDQSDETKFRAGGFVSEETANTCGFALDVFKYTLSIVLLTFSITLIMTAIFTDQTVGTQERAVHPVLAFFLFWVLLIWLGVMEGGQGCLVGLKPIDPHLYSETHQVTLMNTTLSHNGDNMERFIIGRQFLVVLVVFMLNMVSTVAEGGDLLGLPDLIQNIFVSSGIALILTTIVVGQLTAQVTAARCMLDFINNYFMLYLVTYVSLAIEFSGLLHCVYLVQIVFAKLAGTSVKSNEPPRTVVQNVFFWARVLTSLGVLAFAFAVTLTAMFEGRTTSWESIPPTVSVAVFFSLMCFVGLMEGMQIALFAVINLPKEELEHNTTVFATCRIAFHGENLQAFLIGRQICVTLCMFVVARLTTLDMKIGVDENIFGVSDSLQEFLNTGLLGAVITTIVSSLAWRIVASSFPVAFLSNPMVFVMLRLCLVLEGSGICSAAWLLSRLFKRVNGFKKDEEYIGSADERSIVPPGDLELQEEKQPERQSSSSSVESYQSAAR